MTAACAVLLLITASFLSPATLRAQEAYRKPPQQALDVLGAPVPPSASISPARDRVLLAEGVRYPPIADVSQPILRLAGLRINPATTAPHRALYFVRMTLKSIADGAETPVQLPANARAGSPVWSGDGRRFAFTNTMANRVELYVGDAATGGVRRMDGVTVNAAYGQPLQWMPDNRTLLVQLVPANRGAMPVAPQTPAGPIVQESTGRAGQVRTYQDLLRNPYDEQLFAYYATAQLATVDAGSGKRTNIGTPAIYQTLDPAPDGEHILVARLTRPFSYLYPHWAFPKTVEVIDRKGASRFKLADLPLAETPIDGVPVGARSYGWRPTEPATLHWVEALDKGDPRNKVPHRDKIVMLRAPFNAPPTELMRTEHRFRGMDWVESGGIYFVRDYDRDRRFQRVYLGNADEPGKQPRVIFDLDINDRYNEPGTPISRTLPTNQRAVLRSGDYIYFTGQGASPEGDRPFLDRFNLTTLKPERLFRADTENFETFVALLAEDASRIMTRRENPTEPPNFYVRQQVRVITKTGHHAFEGQQWSSQPFTNFPDPAPQLRGIKRQLVKYKRPDGVDLSFTLMLPPDYKPGTRLPTIVWAYPLEFNDPATAGQVSGSTQRYNTIAGASHLFFLLNGYAVLDNATMPIVGSPETANDTFIEQIVASAKAAIDKATEMGVTDPQRVGVGGHSYGAFMTANLLAHSDLFRAGIARSGAYNRTLTPFGFQGERRTFWEASDIYMKLSPFTAAHKINEPILLIHGEADDNPGTFPVQSERMYQAVRGTGGTVRYVVLPAEAHGYAARESVEHTVYEMLAWFDKYVKNAPPRANATAAANASNE